MTDLTEQWKKGELPEGFYYVRDGENMIAEYIDGYFYNNGEPMTSFSGGVDEVLAPVPSYDEYEQLENWNRFTADYHALREAKEIAEYEKVELLEQNTQLKTEYEKECHRADELEDSYWKSEKENQKLKELLKECRDKLKYCTLETYELKTKIDEVLK